MRTTPVVLVAILGLVGARAVREAAVSGRGATLDDAPYTPSASAAPFVAVGYRELLADLLFIRLRVYYGGYYETTAERIAALGEAITALDPRFERVYGFAANAMQVAPHGRDQKTDLRAIALLEKGAKEFPSNWELPMIAGQTYIQDLVTEDPNQRRAWNERGTLLVESAIRKPGAPLKVATWAALLRTRMGQYERAKEGLRELLLITNDPKAQQGLLAALAKMQSSDGAEIASEIYEERRRFEREWKAKRPSLKPSMYLLLGPPLPKSFDMTDLATGGRDVVGSEGFEPLEPLYEEK
jgi:hypothetical protein